MVTDDDEKHGEDGKDGAVDDCCQQRKVPVHVCYPLAVMLEPVLSLVAHASGRIILVMLFWPSWLLSWWYAPVSQCRLCRQCQLQQLCFALPPATSTGTGLPDIVT